MSLSPMLAVANEGLAALRLRMGGDSHEIGFLISAGSRRDKQRLLPAIKELASAPGVQIYATEGTSLFLSANGVPNQKVYRISEDVEPNFASLIRGRKIGMIINVLTDNPDYNSEKSDLADIRRMAAQRLIYLVTEVEMAITTIETLVAPTLKAEHPLEPKPVDLWEDICRRIKEKGGFLNAHAHTDKAYTADLNALALARAAMREKWYLMAEIKRGPLYSAEGLKQRIRRCAQEMVDQGVRTYRTFVDVDTTIGLKAVIAALEVKAEFADRLTMQIGLQPLEGLITNPDACRLFEQAAAMGIDFIGALPSRDEPHTREHLDFVMNLAKKHGIEVDVHVDQANDPAENESEELALATIRHGLQGRVNAVHSISLGTKPREERRRIIQLMKQAGITVFVCPSAALSMEQKSEINAPIRNSIAPVVEMLEAEIKICLGCDNVMDIFMPLSTGNMMMELWMLAEAIRCYDPEVLSDIACGRLPSTMSAV